MHEVIGSANPLRSSLSSCTSHTSLSSNPLRHLLILQSAETPPYPPSNPPVPLAVQYDHEQAEAGAGAEYDGGMFDNRSDGTGHGRGPALPRDEIRVGGCRDPAPPCATINGTHVHDPWAHHVAHHTVCMYGRAAGSSRGAGIKRRCRNARGKWCGRYELQAPVPAKPAPRGSKACPGGCNGVGNCHYDLGTCECPAGGYGGRWI